MKLLVARGLWTAGVPYGAASRFHMAVSWAAAGAIIAAAWALHLYIALNFSHVAWDDSGITLGFSRTLAETGEIRPTPLSDRVEGYSSTLWMLIHAVTFRIVDDPATGLRVAQIATLLLTIVNIGLVFAFGRRLLPVAWAAAAAAAFATLPVAAYETINGMEHPLFLTLLLCAILLYTRRESRARSVAFIVCTSLMVLVRWEAAWFLLPFFAVTVSRRGWRGVLAAEHICWAAVFLGSSAWRLWYFGDVLPNTVLAKSHPPHSPDSLADRYVTRERVLSSLWHLLQPYLVLGVLAVVVAAILPPRRAVSSTPTDEQACLLRVSLLMVGCALIFNIAVGENTGPEGRLFYVAIPCALILIFYAMHAATRRLRPVLRLAALAASLSLAALSAYITVQWHLRSDSAPVYMPGVTVDRVTRIVPALDRLRSAATIKTLVVASPDMGGLLLHSSGLRVIDLGFLCNQFLGRHGRGRIVPYVFEVERPDVIKVQGKWSWGFPAAAQFYRDYVPLYVDTYRFFVRKELLARIDPSALDAGRFAADGYLPGQTRAAVLAVEDAFDREINRKFGSYYQLRPQP
jgi:hypothetical protein